MCTSQKIKFSIKDLSSKCEQIRNFRRIWSHLVEKSLMENFIFCAAVVRVKINIEVYAFNLLEERKRNSTTFRSNVHAS